MNEIVSWGLAFGMAVLSDIPLGYGYTASNIRRMRVEGRSSEEISKYLDIDSQYFGFPDKYGFRMARLMHKV